MAEDDYGYGSHDEPEEKPRSKRTWVIVLCVVGCGLSIPCVGIFATLVIPNVIQNLDVAKESVANSQLLQLANALDQYAIMNGNNYPATLEELTVPDENGQSYLSADEQLLIDPWGNPYVYEPPALPERSWSLRSFGADGLPGGEGAAADIVHGL